MIKKKINKVRHQFSHPHRQFDEELQVLMETNVHDNGLRDEDRSVCI